jgi:hypothetical protein
MFAMSVALKRGHLGVALLPIRGDLLGGNGPACLVKERMALWVGVAKGSRLLAAPMPTDWGISRAVVMARHFQDLSHLVSECRRMREASLDGVPPSLQNHQNCEKRRRIAIMLCHLLLGRSLSLLRDFATLTRVSAIVAVVAAISRLWIGVAGSLSDEQLVS